MSIQNTLHCGEADSPYSWEHVPNDIQPSDLSGAVITRYVGSPRDNQPDIIVAEYATCNDIRRRWFFQCPKEEYRGLMEGIEEAPLALWVASPAGDGTERWAEVFNWLPFRRPTVEGYILCCSLTVL
ncbi:hypothetical protein TGAM01_v208776 [Trichoderma gamsii]|uniref:Uncharacterized protein n=1 Tax=Trichoderma gamsii TaxID=398673 RepID=A0A0W7W3U9_9HYPO|nr:hypothetical protein TGAM01_v208776 [Trichoderma gamsii]PNP46726.1 hypothetical protein TGAMA5MH_01677 [Trichoderma gamsii]PON22293.1 hypothetical protein TGAM01_v208776 [Trichoderma gamsii]